MPKVSEEHAAARREQILAAAQACFARKGFHATSMNDIFAEAGLSAGAVYSYFKSKDEIIATMTSRAILLLAPFFDSVLAEDPPVPLHEVMRRFAALVQELSDGPMSVAPQVWSAATYDPELAPLVVANMRQARAFWTEVASRERKAGRLAPDADPEAVGAVLFTMVAGHLVDHKLLGDISPELLARGLRDLGGAARD
ncbi:MAG: hypothetical protein AUG49_21820 [Catenulispora sp. 13_1_20CM_3_70_7]|nr:TetR/AcrR family transcriptional regulator [Catenulisporales bacterium]OLE21485.1 MAG: hypothetical protein AUG49_21820 [Catenulispora sp. 13_1_20CM_3_70_7]